MAAAGPLKPDVRLAQAISLFEADLPPDGKVAFQEQRLRSSQSRPTSQDVLWLTAKIDSEIIAGKRCFGTRFTNILHAVQKFASIGDVFIGGSQNLIAAGVWSVVRMSILAITNDFSVLERLSALFMTIGQSAPRYQKLAILYPSSGDLHNQLCEYYTVLVELCHKLMKKFKKSKLGKFIASIGESDLAKYQSKLQLWASSIRDEIQLLTSQNAEGEALLNSRFRDISIHFSNTAMQYQKLRIKARALAAYSTYDYESARRRLRKKGQTTVHKHDGKYLEWCDSADASTLVVNGKLGSGKSVLLANVVDDISLEVMHIKPIVTYFFCEVDILESLNAQTVVGSLLGQVLNALPDSPAFDKILGSSDLTREASELVDLLVHIMPNDRPLFIILDGVQNCLEQDFVEILSILKRLQGILKVYLCVSRRFDGREFVVDGTVHKFNIPENNPDIDQFIHSELVMSIQNDKLVLGDPTLSLEIQEALQKGAQGMFLWVALQFEALYQEHTDAAIREALKNLPKTLVETFARILRLSKSSSYSKYQESLFNLIMAAVRPLNLEELREALSVEPGNTKWDRIRMINNIQAVVSNLGGLVTIDEENLAVRLVHPSVKQFLLHDSDDRKENFKTQSFMCDIVITCLSYKTFRKGLITSDSQPHHRHGSVDGIRTTGSSDAGKELALKLLRHRKANGSDIEEKISKVYGGSAEVSQFFGYARENLRSHAWVYILQSSQITSSLRQHILPNVESIFIPLNRDWLIGEAAKIEWDSDEGLRWLITLIQPNLSLDSQELTGDNFEPFSLYDSQALVDKAGYTPWDWTIQHGYTDVLHRFFATPGKQAKHERCIEALFKLLRWNYLDVASELLSIHDWDLNIPIEFPPEELKATYNIINREETTILPLVVVFATFPKRYEAVSLLLKHGADADLDWYPWQSAFFHALALQRWDIAEAFAAAGSDLDQVLEDGRTMLMRLCCPMFRPKAVAWLVQHGALTSLTDLQGHGLLWNGGMQFPTLIRLLRCAGISQNDPLWQELSGTVIGPLDQAMQDDLNIVRRASLKGMVGWNEMPDLSTGFNAELTAPRFGQNQRPFGRDPLEITRDWYSESPIHVHEWREVQLFVAQLFEGLQESNGDLNVPSLQHLPVHDGSLAEASYSSN